MKAAATVQAEGITVLQSLRRVQHSIQHICDVTVGLSKLAGLKKGAIDSVLADIGQISQSLERLQAVESQQVLIQCRVTEVGAK
jgi:hypothetical protein